MCRAASLIAAVLLMMAAGVNGAFDPNTDPALVGHWTFDEGTGKVASDSSGNGNDGTLLNGAKWVDGILGAAVEFDGTDDYVDTPQAEDLPKWTICCWVKSPAAPAGTSPTGPMHRESNYQLNWNHSDAVFRGSAAMNNGGTWYAAKYEPLEADTWYHLAATYDGETLSAYRDGALITANTAPTGNPSAEANTLKFGRHAAAAQYFRGTVDDARLYRRALTAEEIRVLAPPKPPKVKAEKPDPANGSLTVNPMVPLLRWSKGPTAFFHDVYLGTSPELTEADRVATRLPAAVTLYYHLAGFTPGTTYYWRVDAIEADGVTIHTGDVWTFMTQAATAYYPSPADGANDAAPHPTLTWLAGAGAIQHHLYFGASADAVAQGAADTDKGTLDLADASFDPNVLEPLTTYFWRVDEGGAGGVVQAGPVWSFTTAKVIDDFEAYTDEEGSRIYESWVDGYTDTTNGSMVGYLEAPFAEQVTVHGGSQSMPLDYNNVEAPFYSQAELAFASAQDWTAGGADTLLLYVRGRLINKPEPLYVRVEDSAKKSATIVHPDPAAISSRTWIEWKIPFSEIAASGVSLSKIRIMQIGVGDRADPKAGGKGIIFVDDVLLTRPAPAK